MKSKCCVQKPLKDDVSVLDVTPLNLSPICSSKRNSSSGCRKVLAASNRHQALKPPDESQCACNWMQSARALPPPLSRMLMSFLMGPLIRKSHVNSCQSRPGNDGSSRCLLAVREGLRRPDPISSRQEDEKKQLHLLFPPPVEERGERCDGNAAPKSRAKSAVSLRQMDPSIILSRSLTNPSAG